MPESEAKAVAQGTLRRVFHAVEDLKAELSIDESGFSRIAPEAQADARDFYIFEALDEVQKMAAALLPQSNYPGPEEQDDDAVTRIVKESFVDHSALWQRKLAEALAEIICFRTSPEVGYFRDYLLLARLDQVLSSQLDQKTFWGAESENFRHQAQELATKITELEATGLDLGRAWYRRTRKALPAQPQPGQLFASFNKRLKHALQEGNEIEKVALGLSYGAVFARTSASLHARPGQLDPSEHGDLMEHLRVPIFIGLNVLVGCQKILNKVPGEHNEFFRRAIENSPGPMEVVGQITNQRAAVGDLVVAHGELCEVLKVVSGPYGYKTYRVRYLTQRLIPSIGEDYVVAPQVAVIFTVAKARETVEEQMALGRIPQRTGDRMLAMSDADLIAAFRVSTVDLWNAGIGFKEAITGGSASTV